MKKILVSIMLSTLLAGLVFAKDVLLTIHNQDVTADEFLRIYNKNNNSTTIDNKSIAEYLELFINFKLKVIEAESLGYDTLKVFKDEFETYRKQLVKPYLVDKTIEEGLIKEAYDRIVNEVNVSHIVVSVNKNASPADTVKAYNKITSIYHRVVSNGEDFNEVAKASSDDPSAKTNEGRLGFFKAFNMVYPFESVAYATKVGEVSKPFRTGFGFHILKVHDMRPSPGEVKVAHIMKSFPSSMTDHQKDSLRHEIDHIYKMVQEGGDFAEIATNYSDDGHSAAQGGELPWFSTGKMIASFADVSFGLKEIGDVSKPMETRYGWHIIKKLDWKGISSFEEMKEDLTEKVKRDAVRTKLSEEVVVNRLKDEYDFKANRKNLKYAEPLLNEKVYRGKWEKPSRFNDVVLASFANQELKMSGLLDYIAENQKITSVRSMDLYVDRMFKEYVRASVIAYEETQLDKKYPEYKHLVQEYHDGILLFNLTDELVWSKAIADTTGLKEYFEQNGSKYVWGDRIDAKIYSSKNGKTISKLRKKLKKGAVSDDQVLSMFCDSTMKRCIRIKEGVYETENSEILKGVTFKEGVSKVLKNEDNHYVILVDKLLKPEQKKLNEAKGLVTADYQQALENAWVKGLREKYEININSERLAELENKTNENQ